MKKFFGLLIFLIVLSGCEKNFDGIVETENPGAGYSIVSVSVPDTFRVNQNSDIEFSVVVNAESTKPDLYAYLKKGNKTIASSPLSYSVNSSTGFIEYSGNFQNENLGNTGFYSFSLYDDNKMLFTSTIYIIGNNEKPIVSDLSMPDSVAIGETFIFSIKASDPDGSGDIAGVYYNVYTPDGNLVTNSQGISDFPLSDNGDTDISGDEVANDQIYTMKLAFPSGSQTGTWQFKFFAIDRAREQSNVITHNLTVSQ